MRIGISVASFNAAMSGSVAPVSTKTTSSVVLQL